MKISWKEFINIEQEMTQEKYYLTAKKICMHAYSIPFYSVQPFQYRPVQGENIIKIFTVVSNQ